MSNLGRTIERRKNRERLTIIKVEERKAAENHPTTEYVKEMLTELDSLNAQYPDLQYTYKDQIQAIRNKCEETITDQRTAKKEIIETVTKKFQDFVKQIDGDYRDKEIWTLMRGLEYELNEVKDIIKNDYAEKK